MRAMLLEAAGSALVARELPVPLPDPGQVRVKVACTGVCRTDLHVRDGELREPKLPLVLGHQIVGRVDAVGGGVDGVALGDRVGVPWLGWTCGSCGFCSSGRENLCGEARFTGYQIDGGFAEWAVTDARYALPIPEGYSDLEAAPLLCGGVIGYRALRMAGDAKRVGLYGFGAAAHLVAQVAVFQGREVFAFTRAGDAGAQALARRVGVRWVGGSDERPPDELDAALVFAPVGALVPAALRAVSRGGAVVCAGIHMSDIPSFPYEILWGERRVQSVANLTRQDGLELLALAPKARLRSEVTRYALSDAERALDDLRAGRFSGAAVVEI